MTDTIDAIHGKLNPTVLKEQALDQFREAKEAVKEEVVEDFEKMKNHIREEVKQQFADAKERLAEEYSGAKTAVREATVGKVGDMIRTASEYVQEAGSGLLHAIQENPIPGALGRWRYCMADHQFASEQDTTPIPISWKGEIADLRI